MATRKTVGPWGLTLRVQVPSCKTKAICRSKTLSAIPNVEALQPPDVGQLGSWEAFRRAGPIVSS